VKRLKLSSRSAATAADHRVGAPVVSMDRPWARHTMVGGGLGSGEGELHDPQCLCIAGDMLLVAEWGNHRISVFDKTTLAFVRHVGENENDGSGWVDGGSGDGELDQPCGVAAHDDEIFVADTWNHRISVFELATGKWLRSFGSRGDQPGQFTYPTGITIAQGGRLYVTERTGKRVQMLTLDGDPLQVLPAPCGGWLYGVCADGERLWATSSSTNEVHLFSTRGWEEAVF